MSIYSKCSNVTDTRRYRANTDIGEDRQSRFTSFTYFFNLHLKRENPLPTWNDRLDYKKRRARDKRKSEII